MVSFHQLQVEKLLDVESSAIEKTEITPDICHAVVGREMFATQVMSKGSIPGYYRSFVIYEDLSSAVSLFKKYGQSIMTAIGERFLDWANRLPGTATERNIVHHALWLAPTPL